MTPSPHPSPEFARRREQDVALAIGRLTLSWNSIHATFGAHFCAQFGDADQPKARVIWTSSEDRRQRELLISVMDLQDSAHVTSLDREIRWAVGQLESLANHRNASVHTPFSFSIFVEEGHEPDGDLYFDYAPHPGAGPTKRAIRLADKDALALFQAVCHWLDEIDSHLMWHVSKRHTTGQASRSERRRPARPSILKG